LGFRNLVCTGHNAYDTQKKLKAPIKKKAPEGKEDMWKSMLEEAKKGLSK